MRCYTTLRNVKEDFTIDGIRFATPDGTDVFLDFSEHDWYKPSEYKSCVRMKSAMVQIDGDDAGIEDNDEVLFGMLKTAKLEEVVLYSERMNRKQIKKIKVGYLKIETPNGELFFKTNKCHVV